MLLKPERCKRSHLPRLFFKVSVLTCALAAMPVLILPATVYAQDIVASERQQYAIPAGSLSNALTQFSKRSGLSLSKTADIGASVKSVGLQGDYTAKEALEILLSGTGVTYQLTADNIELLVAVSNGEATVLEPLLVIGTAPQRYEATSASSATGGIEIDLLDTPRSIQVVPEQVFVDQGARDLRDVLRNVSGVQSRNISGGITDAFIVRGVSTTDVSKNGFQVSDGEARVQTSNIERVEVVKGPTAILSGQSQAGGIINIITKKPEAESRNVITFNADEFGQREILFDSTGKLTKDGKFLYRLVASTEDSETFREAASDSEIKRDLFAPSLTWNISENDKLTASFEYSSSEIPLDNGTVVVQSADGSFDVADVDESLRFGEDEDLADTQQRTFNLEYEHFFENDWQLDVDFSYSSGGGSDQSNLPVLGVVPVPGVPLSPLVTNIAAGGGATVNLNALENGAILGRRPNFFDRDNKRINFSLKLSGDIDFGTTEHNLTVGADFNRRELNLVTSQALISAADAGVALPPIPGGPVFLSDFNGFDIFNPEFGQTSEATETNDFDSTDTQIGVFVSDNIRFNDQWNALVGLRLDYFEREGEDTNTFANTTALGALNGLAFQEVNEVVNRDRDAEIEFSPNLGLVYKPLDNISLFTSYSESFLPQFARNNLTGVVLDVDPIESSQIEVGVKGAFLKNKLILGLAYFDITRENIVGNVTDLTGVPAFNDEEVRRGVEFDSNIQFANGFSLNFNASHIIEAEIKDGTNTGNVPRNVADTTANLWATYEFTGGSLQGLGIGGGANFVGKRFVDDDNSFELDSQTTYDATAFYYIPVSKGTQVRLQAGIKNLTDKEHFITNNGPLTIGVGEPRTFTASISYEF